MAHETPIYLNNAGTSWPKPDVVVRAVRTALESSPAALADDVASATRTVVRYLGLPSAEGLLFTSGCTSALSAAILGLPWAAGDAVVTSALEHHAVDGVIQRLVSDHGVAHTVVPYAPRMPFDLAFLRDRLARGDVRLVAFSGASNVTGDVLPARDIVQLAHDHGALCLLDAAQTAGVIPIDARALGVDLLCIAGHKGPLGPQGVGVLWSAPQVRFRCPAAVCAVGAAPLARAPGYCDVGGMNLPGVLGLSAGLAWLEAHPDAARRARDLASELVATLRDRPGVTVFRGDGPGTAAVSFTSRAPSLESAEAFFAERGVVVRAGAHCAPRALEAIGAPAGTIRVSFGCFSEESHLERVVGAIDAALGHSTSTA